MLTPIDKQIIRSWYQYVAEPHFSRFTGRVLRAIGPRIAVVGTCQSFSVAYAIKLLRPEAKVDHFPVMSRSHAPLETFIKTLKTYDYVLLNDFPRGFIPGGGSSELRDRLRKTFVVPTITFSAFHPDSISVGDDEVRSPIFGPLGPYHSAIALFAFRKGLPLEEANALFNRNVFEALGYFDFWNDASAELIDRCKRESDLDLSAEFMVWTRRGIFMHTINHPKPFVLVDVARKLLAHMGLPAPDTDTDCDAYMIDDFLRYPIFPVYPQLAAHFGRLGSFTFHLTTADFGKRVGDYLTLPQFLYGSYDKYRQYGSKRLTNPRVDAWSANAATTEMIVSLARKNLEAGLLPVR